jgi:tetratricopeptide (TPR) repeat protein
MNSPTKEQILKTLKEAQNAFTNCDYRAALEKYQWVEKHIQDDPENLPVIWIEIGWSYYLLQDFIPAIQFLEKAIKSPHINEKQLFDCLRLIGFSYEYSANTDKAIAFLQDAINRDVEDDLKRYVYFELGKIFFAQNLTREAKPYLEKANALFIAEDHEYPRSTTWALSLFLREKTPTQNFFSGNTFSRHQILRLRRRDFLDWPTLFMIVKNMSLCWTSAIRLLVWTRIFTIRRPWVIFSAGGTRNYRCGMSWKRFCPI